MSTTGKDYKWLAFTGPISVVTVAPEDVKGVYLFVFLLMGPTGSGKSTFIESLSLDENLKISKDSLESVTQDVFCYQVVNLAYDGWTVLLVDTPGFLDTKMSESRITVKIKKTLDRLRQSAGRVAVYILYFQPITNIRLGGSKRNAVKLLRAFADSFKAGGINAITTMWNHISTPKQIEDANRRFSDLKNEIFATSDELRIDVTRFEFSSDSALSILDNVYWGWNHDINELRNMDPQYQSLILNNLVDRITSTQLQLQNLAEDKQNATTLRKEDHLLLDVVLRDEKAASEALQSFAYDLCILDPTVYQTIFPGVPFPPHPAPAKTRSGFIAKFHRAVPFKKVFGRKK